MPKAGDVRKHLYSSGKVYKEMYAPCIQCGKGRWQIYRTKGTNRPICRSCSTRNTWGNAGIKEKRTLGILQAWDEGNRREIRRQKYTGKGNPFYGKKHSSRVLAIMSKPRTRIRVKPTTDWGYLIGLVLGDGWLNKREGSYRVGVSSTRPEIVEKFHEVCESLGIHSSYYKLESFYCSEVCSKELYEYLRPCKCEDFHFRIPAKVYKNKTMAHGFLMGFFDAEGGVYKTNGGNATMNIQCWSKHIENLRQVRDLLKMVGIESYLHKEKKKQISARLCISDYENRCLFRSLVGFRIERKQKRLDDMEKPFGKSYTIEQYEWAMKLRDEGYAIALIEKITGVNKNTVGVWYHKRGNGHMIRAERRKRNIIMNDEEINPSKHTSH